MLSVPSPVLGAVDQNGADLAPALRRGEGIGTCAFRCKGGITARKGSSVQLSDLGDDILAGWNVSGV